MIVVAVLCTLSYTVTGFAAEKAAPKAAAKGEANAKRDTIDDVKTGIWVGGILKKAEGDGNDVVVKLNIGVKQKEASKKKADSKEGESKKK